MPRRRPLIGGWLVAARLARRLAGPAIELAKSAVLVGNGGVLDEPDPTGVSEFDDLAHALAASSQRVNDALQRERQFSADVSHQLRTPLTGLRLTLETAAAQPGADGSLTPALAELERVEATITHLLAFARDAIPVAASTEIADAVRHAETHWAARVRATGRRLVSVTVPKGEVKASATSIDQILNILIDNALAHGRGTITVATRQVGGALAIDVADEGTGIDPRQRDRIFARGEGSHHGIGLALARSIAEAEGARLLLSRAEPTTFSLILLTDHGPGDGPGPGTWTGPDNGAGHGPHDRTA